MKKNISLENNTENFLDYIFSIVADYKVLLLVIASLFILIYILVRFIDSYKEKRKVRAEADRIQKIRTKRDLEDSFKNWLQVHVTHAKWRTLHESHHSFDIYFQGIYLKMIKLYKNETGYPQPEPLFLDRLKGETKKWLIVHRRVSFKKERRIN